MNRSTCSIRRCCFNIVAGVDAALVAGQNLQPLRHRSTRCSLDRTTARVRSTVDVHLRAV